MPDWAGKWEGGRFYLDEAGRPVYFIERKGRVVKAGTSESLALGQLALFLEDPVKFMRQRAPEPDSTPQSVFITTERLNLYMQSIRTCVQDHRDARWSYLKQWSEKQIDLTAAEKRTLREKLAEWDGGHRGRVEALNAFCNFLVEEGDLKTWKRFVNPFEAKQTRAARVIYTLKELQEKFKELQAGPIRDVFFLRASAGLHQTEIDQLYKAKTYTGPLPDKGTGIRVLGEDHQIKGVLQVKHKNGQRHRVSLDRAGLDVALRLREGVPSRVAVWKRLSPMTPSNLRHTFVTLMGEIGTVVEYKSGGISRAQVAQLVGHRAGSTMTADKYENIQIPAMGYLPITTADPSPEPVAERPQP